MKRLSRFLLTLLIAIAAPATALAQTVEPVRAGDRTLGSATAPVTLTVYLSTTCSHCANWHTNDFPAFKARWVDTGQVRVAFRDLPTPPQQIAIAGAAGGLTRDQMNACFSSEASFTEVEARAEQSFADGVNGTPSFFVNGQPLPETMAALDVAAFEPLIQPLLDGR